MKLLHRYQISRQAKCTYVDLNMNATTAARFQHYPTAIDATIKENIQLQRQQTFQQNQIQIL